MNKHKIILSVFLLFVPLFCGCYYEPYYDVYDSHDRRTTPYEEAYEEGYEKGWDEGFSEGYYESLSDIDFWDYSDDIQPLDDALEIFFEEYYYEGYMDALNKYGIEE